MTTLLEELKEKAKLKFNEIYPVIHIGFDGNGTEYFRREKSLEMIEEAIADTISTLLLKIESELAERRKLYHKDCLTDMFINGRFWEVKDLEALLQTYKTK